MLHEIQLATMGFRLYLIHLFGIPAVLGVVLSAGLGRVFQGRAAWYWTGYALWMGVAAPFSGWKGSSLELFFHYVRADFILLIVIAGLTLTWRECKLMMHAAAWGAVADLVASFVFQSNSDGGRFGLAFGTVANPNDWACHLLFATPFLLWIVLYSKSLVARLLAFAGVGGCVYLILSTASRGAALGLVAAVLFMVYRGTTRQRIALMALAPIVLGLAITAVSTPVLRRIRSFSRDDASASAEALESSESRKYVFQKSLEYTLQHPIVGIGPGQFADYEGQNNTMINGHGYYHGTHSTLTQVSSECGIPALFFFAAGLVCTYRLLSATYRTARQRPECEDIRNVAFCLMLSFVGFGVAMSFLNFAYFYYGPALGGLAIAVSRAAKTELARRSKVAGTPAGRTVVSVRRAAVHSRFASR
jgi:hypothetical protein